MAVSGQDVSPRRYCSTVDALAACSAHASVALARLGEEPDDIEEMVIMAVHMVCTLELIRKLNPGQNVVNTPHGRPGIMAMTVDIDPSKFTSKFGLWLSESISTTSRDDDLSNVWITHRTTQWDAHVAQFAERLKATRPIDMASVETVLTGIETWAQDQRPLVSMWGESLLSQQRELFAWPVLGSRAADGIEEPEPYFDMCAGRIRAMRPLAVTNWRGENVPESLQVCRP